jgi:hypothetical protein
MGRKTHTRTTIETERISIIACRHISYGRCELCGQELETSGGKLTRSLMKIAPKYLEPASCGKPPWERARQRLVLGLKSLLRFLETGTQPNS